ncbi:MAG: hypothetical protein V3V16_00295 [Melioribacteraceae bacterium]
MNKTKPQLNVFLLLGIPGFLIICYAIFLNFISPEFTYAAKPEDGDVVNYVLVRIFIGIVYALSVIIFLRKRETSKKILALIFTAGFIARLILVPTVPILEDDFNRYLWDGAVTAKGYNPFQYSPKEFIDSTSSPEVGPEKLHTLANESGKIIQLINHPHIRTIYPPVAQFGFAISYLIKPWSVPVWKALILIVDLIVFVLLLVLLGKLNYIKNLVIIYWWNPILIHEFYSAGHMDILMYPLLLLAVLMFMKQKYISSTSFLALSAGVKVWPVALIPIVLVKIFKNKKIFFTALVTSALIILIQLFPIILTKLDNSLGFVTYTKNWTNNEAVFQLINLGIKEIIKLFEINYHCSLCVARWIVMSLFGVLVLFLSFTSTNNNERFILKSFLLVTILYLISPTQFPWYYTWALPFLVLNPRLSFIIYAAFLPLYQLKYNYPILIWIEHLPIVILFLVELTNKKIANFFDVKKLAK